MKLDVSWIVGLLLGVCWLSLYSMICLPIIVYVSYYLCIRTLITIFICMSYISDHILMGHDVRLWRDSASECCGILYCSDNLIWAESSNYDLVLGASEWVLVQVKAWKYGNCGTVGSIYDFWYFVYCGRHSFFGKFSRVVLGVSMYTTESAQKVLVG